MSGPNSTTVSALSLDAKQKEDLDIFLSTIESKLRGPFSSLDLAKSVATTALRKGALTPKQYLQQIAKVIERTDKVVQLRMIIGLLGLDPPTTVVSSSNNGEDGDEEDEKNINPEIYKILEIGLESKEEWVKAISGLTQGIMFHDGSDSRESCIGEYAQKLLQKTGREIAKRVQTQVDKQQSTHQNEAKEDLNASFAPYRYALIPNELLEPIIPECCNGANPHFKTRSDAAILKMDEKLDAQRAKEEQEHRPVLPATTSTNASAGGAMTNTTKRDLPPGYRPTNLVNKATTSKKDPPKTNMFITKTMSGGTTRQQLLKKTVLRRKGTAQTLVSKANIKGRVGAAGSTGVMALGASAAATATSLGASGRAAAGSTSKLGSASARARAMMAANRSKMKMIDVQEVNTLNQEHAKRDTDMDSRSSKKRRILELAAQRGLGQKKTKLGAAPAGGAPVKVEAATDADDDEPVPAEEPAGAVMVKEEPDMDHYDDDSNGAGNQQQEEWQILLQERSNKLSDEDRVRVQQFFESQHNPTPGQQVYKMKLHEQRTTDPQTGQAIKETFYLELDYDTFQSKQSKKTKRY